MKVEQLALRALALAKTSGQQIVLLNAGANHVIATWPQMLWRHEHAQIIGTYEPTAQPIKVIADLDIHYQQNDVELTIVDRSLQVKKKCSVKQRLRNLLREHITELENDRQKCEQRIANLEQQITFLMEEK